jgi:hypothetical protein
MIRNETMSYFFGNLSRLIHEARIPPRQLSAEIGRDADFVTDVIHRRRPMDLEAVYALSEALKVDVADLLRPGASFGFAAREPGKYWAEKVAEKVLASALEDNRQRSEYEPPSFDAVLNWWHATGGLLTNIESFEQYVEIFSPPDEAALRPVPKRLGARSLAARELNISTVEQLSGIFENSEPAVARSVALAHAGVLEGQPKLSFHSILIDLSTGQLVKLSYFRLLLPVRDGDGQRYVMNYSKPVRRSEIGREHVDEFEPIHGGQPVLAGLD